VGSQEEEQEEEEGEQEDTYNQEARECRQKSVRKHLIENKDLGENMVSTFQKTATVLYHNFCIVVARTATIALRPS
jgi:hypothetical protein